VWGWRKGGWRGSAGVKGVMAKWGRLCVIICGGCGCVYAAEGGGVRIIVRRPLCGGIGGGFVRSLCCCISE